MSRDVYEPELGQAMFGNPTSEYKVSDFVKALFWYIFKEAERVHWNINQRQLEAALDNVPTGHAVEIGPLSLRRYQWADQEEHPEIAALPNFTFEDVEMRWYKHPGRGMSTNKNWTYSEWVDWFDRCLKALRDLDRERSERP